MTCEGRRVVSSEIIAAEKLSKNYELSKGLFFGKKTTIRAVTDVYLRISEGEVCGVVGESGCGKSTLGRLVLKLEEPSGGKILFRGEDLGKLSGQALKSFRKKAQIIFQDPYASLNPRQPVGSAIEEGLIVHNLGSRKERKDRVRKIAEVVGLGKEHLALYPHELSGGQRQRVCIARSLILQPEFIVCDEPLSALDVSIQAQIINLLVDLQESYGLTYLFISHDLSVIRHLADKIVVMYLGQIVEESPKKELFDHPLHPYTKTLLESIPVHHPALRKRRRTGVGELLRPIGQGHLDTGCIFEPRCTVRQERCKHEMPLFKEVSPGHYVRCLLF